MQPLTTYLSLEKEIKSSMHHTARRLRSESANPHLQAIYPNQKPACFLALLISTTCDSTPVSLKTDVEMGDRQVGNYGLRRAAPKKISQDYTYFGLKKDEPEAKKVKVEDVQIEFLSSPDVKKARGRSRKTNPAAPETRKESKEATEQQFLEIDASFSAKEDAEEEDSTTNNLVEVVTHAEEIITFENPNDYVVDNNGESIQIMEFPMRIETDSKKVYTEEDDYTESGTEIKIECGECHKVLKPSSYRQHVKTHLGGKPHGCELCPAKFTRRGDVDRHVRIVHNKDKPYFCPKCTRSFGDKKNLKWHLMNHDKKLFHVCETCGFKFGKKDYYDNHVKYIHPLPTYDNEAEEAEDDDNGSFMQSDDPSEQIVTEEDTMVIRKAVTLPGSDSSGRAERNNLMELSEKQLHDILEQSQSSRIAIVGQHSGVKYLTVTPKNANKSSPQVVSLKDLEKITNMSSQQIVKMHSPNETDPSKLKAVVIEVVDVVEQPLEEIVIDSGEAESPETAESANVDLIEALLDAAHNAGCLFMVVQKPLSGGQPLSEAQWLQTIYLAVGRLMVSVLWIYGISLSGPFRAILVCEQYDFVVVAGFAALTSGSGANSAFRGAVTFVIGLMVLLFLDHDEGNLHPDAEHGGSWIGLADHKVGVILMVLVMLVQVGVNTIANKLGSSLGGQKRIHALTTVTEGIMLIPVSVFVYFYKGASSDFTFSTYILPMITASVCIYVLEFYINSFTLQKLPPNRVARVGSISVFLSSLLCAYLWSSAANQVTKADPTSYTVADHSLSGGSIFACILFILASLSLTSDLKQGTKGSFIGYSETGLPLYSFRNSALHQTSKSFFNLGATIVKQILASQNSRKIFYFLCLNMGFTVVEFVYGVWTNSLGLISDGFHMLFDCSALIMGLIASVMATWKPSRTFSYGYNRVEDLSGFVNGLFLLVISFGVFTEAVKRLFDPPDINTNQLLAVSFAGLCVNLLGILAFRSSHGHSHGGHHHGHSHNSNMEGLLVKPDIYSQN
ncbi:Hypothetical predicted protein [Cloeon dipterum]|uniref:Proton-coupled zinc antiporter SLC30A5 n=1 Tax=Cloeon dipterum TaxID=197152 RepID=A0A8S1DAC4_9INSE|nr:Hypothetical predicted protein [Cloeon dipterum]